MTQAANTFTAKRLAQDEQSSVAHWFGPDGTPLCYCLEPGYKREPHPGIPAGTYRLGLRTVGEKHTNYLKWYGPDFHKGMVEICDVPGREFIEFHVGNTIADTQGCSLAGGIFIEPPGRGSGHYEVMQSRRAYEAVYPILRDAILAGAAQLIIVPAGAMA